MIHSVRPPDYAPTLLGERALRVLHSIPTPSPTEVVVEPRHAFGVRRLYPISRCAFALAGVAGTLTLDQADLDVFARDLGLTVRVLPDVVA
jgi:hypothetical protein